MIPVDLKAFLFNKNTWFCAGRTEEETRSAWCQVTGGKFVKYSIMIRTQQNNEIFQKVLKHLDSENLTSINYAKKTQLVPLFDLS